MLKYFIVITSLLFVSCNIESNAKFSVIEDSSCGRIEINEFDISVVKYSDVLKIKSFCALSNEIPLGNVQRAFIKDNKLYISDSQPKIVCFNISNGAIEFEISKIGKGPGEFIDITDFLVNEEKNVLTIFCQKRKKLINFSSINGNYINENSIDFIPIKIANIGESNIFYNPFKLVLSNEYNYTLLFSGTEKPSVTSRAFVHDPILSSYMYDYGYEFPFFYNSNELFFIKRFENTVYRINNKGAFPLYNIIIPNSAPIEFWKKKPDTEERAQAHFSQSLTNIYQCGNILHFRFTYQNRFIYAFYDVENDHVITIGQLNLKDVSENVPIVFPIRGVYKDTFFALADPLIINDLKKIKDVKLPKNILSIKETDNPLLIFYKTIK